MVRSLSEKEREKLASEIAREPLHKLIDSGTFDQWRLRCDDG